MSPDNVTTVAMVLDKHLPGIGLFVGIITFMVCITIGILTIVRYDHEYRMRE